MCQSYRQQESIRCCLNYAYFLIFLNSYMWKLFLVATTNRALLSLVFLWNRQNKSFLIASQRIWADRIKSVQLFLVLLFISTRLETPSDEYPHQFSLFHHFIYEKLNLIHVNVIFDTFLNGPRLSYKHVWAQFVF